MGIEWVSFVFGILLLFIALVGGGFEVREIKVPRVGRVARTVSAGVGLVFLAIGITGLAEEPPGAPTAQAQIAPQEQAPAPTGGQRAASIDFTVHDELGDLQITEQLKVYIDDRLVGTLTVDGVHPRSHIAVTVPEPGRYSYRLESTSTFDLDDGPADVPGAGSGQVEVGAGDAFSVVYEVGDTGLVLRLE